MTDQLESTAAALLEAATRAGADAADVLCAFDTSVSIEVREGRLEQATRSENTDAGLRVFVGRRQAVVSASDTRPETLAAMAERAVAMAREAPEDIHAGLADPAQLSEVRGAGSLELADPAHEPDAESLERDALDAEAAALDVKGVEQVQTAGADYYAGRVHMAATNGFSGGYDRTNRSIACVAIAGKGTGMERSYDSDSRIFQSDLRPASPEPQAVASCGPGCGASRRVRSATELPVADRW